MKTVGNGGRTVHVAHVVQNLAVGGLERVVLNLASRADPCRYRSSIVCMGSGGELAALAGDAGIEVHALHKPPGLRPGVVVRLARVFRRSRVGVVHCHNAAPLLYGSLAARIGGAAGVVYTAHGVKTSGAKKPVLLYRMGLVDHFVTVSEDARRIAIDKAGAPAARVRTIVNGVDTVAFARPLDSERRERRRSQIGVPNDAFAFGIVARLSKEKDHENLFSAFAALAHRDPRLYLVVVGDGGLRSVLEYRLGELRMEGRIVLLGGRNDVPDLLGTFDCFVLSSYTEGLAMTLLEAMAAGLPVVTTDVGGNAEVVVDGETGLVVPPRDTARLAEAMQWMATHRGDAAAMGRRGRERAVASFSLEAMVSAYEAAYEQVLRRGST